MEAEGTGALILYVSIRRESICGELGGRGAGQRRGLWRQIALAETLKEWASPVKGLCKDIRGTAENVHPKSPIGLTHARRAT